MSAWVEPPSVVDPGGLGDVPARWEALSWQWPTVVRLVRAGEADRAEESVGVAPALADLVAAFSGAALGGVVLDWPTAASEGWPELGEDRHAYQPMWSSGREAVVVRIAPDGAAGDVVRVRGDGGVDLEAGGLDVVAPDVLTFWHELTGWAEQALTALVEEVTGEVESPEELELVLEEGIEELFADWLAAVARHPR